MLKLSKTSNEEKVRHWHMPNKTFNHSTFTFVDENGKVYNIYCYSTRTNIRTTEHAETYVDGYSVEGKSYWYNRPWQRFDYENALYALASKLAGKNTKRMDAFKLCIDAEAKSESDACDAFIAKFKKDYDSLSDNTKKHLANADITINSVEQADSIMKISKAFDTMFRLMDNDKGSAF